MALTATADVLVIASDCSEGSQVRLASRQFGWQTIESPTPARMLDQLRLTRAKVVILEIADDWDDNFDLLPILHEYPRRLSLMVADVGHDPNLEAAVRAEGVDCFISGDTSLALLQAYVARLSEQANERIAAAPMPGVMN
jgi:hypothetical protein